ncbi:MAG: DegT/DnrJ/EryC1/StrS family aminotransferase [Nitrospirae bacterium]|nr:DegT/DnrJ/EryC1/StrS family aminotransferase [Nitrospirota bacterium]
MNIPFIFLSREMIAEKDIYYSAFERTLKSCKYILGESVLEIENRLSKYLGVKHLITVNSGTDALMLSLRVLGVCAGDEVITVSNSFVATVGAIAAVGATPVLVDVGDDLLIDTGLIEKKITSATKAIIPVHLTGRPANMKMINDIANRHSLYVIDDAAQSFGAEYNGVKYFDASATCYSFHPYKNFHCLGDGGAIATNNDNICASLLKLRNHGISEGMIDRFGYNCRLDEIHAAVLLSTLDMLEDKLKMRRQIARKYCDSLSDIIDVPNWDSKIMQPSFQTFIVKTEKRDELSSYLRDNAIETAIHYPVPCHKYSAGISFDRGDLLRTEKLSQRILSLPISHLMTDNEQQYVIDKTIGFFYGKSTVCRR